MGETGRPRLAAKGRWLEGNLAAQALREMPPCRDLFQISVDPADHACIHIGDLDEVVDARVSGSSSLRASQPQSGSWF